MQYLHYYNKDLLNYLGLDDKKYSVNYIFKKVLYKTKKHIDYLYELDENLICILKSKYIKCSYQVLYKLVKNAIIIKETKLNDIFNEKIDMITI